MDYDCPQGIDPQDRLKLLHRIVDGQASDNEETFFFDSIKNCNVCVCKDICNEHIKIKSVLKQKFQDRPLPEDLIDQIKDKIQEAE